MQRADRGAEALGQADREHVGDPRRSRRAACRWRRGRSTAGRRRGAPACRVGPPTPAGRAGRRSATTVPPAKLWVFSTETAAVRTKNGPMSGACSPSIAARSTRPRSPVQVRIVMPLIAPCAPSSARAMWADDSHSTSSPGCDDATRTASTLAIDPVGVNSAASWPNRPATRSCERGDRRVLAVDVVADLGAGHRGPHRLGRTGEGVGAQVDHGGEPTRGTAGPPRRAAVGHVPSAQNLPHAPLGASSSGACTASRRCAGGPGLAVERRQRSQCACRAALRPCGASRRRGRTARATGPG